MPNTGTTASFVDVRQPLPNTHASPARAVQLVTCAVVIALAAIAVTGTAVAGSRASVQGANLAPTKTFLLRHTSKLHGLTGSFRAQATRYFALAKSANFEYATLWRTERAAVVPILRRSKALWIEGNPYYRSGAVP